MEPSKNTVRHEYRKRLTARFMYVFLGSTAVTLFSLLWFTEILPTDHTLTSYALVIFMLMGGVFIAFYGIRTRVVIDGDHIEVRGAFFSRGADLAEIEGFRNVPTRHSFTQRLYLRGGRGTILIETELATDDYFSEWLQRVKCLDTSEKLVFRT